MPMQTYNQYFGPPQQHDVGNALVKGAMFRNQLQQNALAKNRDVRAERQLGMLEQNYAQQRAMQERTMGRQDIEWKQQDKDRATKLIGMNILPIDITNSETFPSAFSAAAKKTAQELASEFGPEQTSTDLMTLQKMVADMQTPEGMERTRNTVGLMQKRLYGLTEPEPTFEEKEQIKAKYRAPAKPSMFRQLIDERNSLSPGDPRRKDYDMKIAKETALSIQQGEGIDVDAMAEAVADQTLTTGQIPKRGAVWAQVASKVKEINPKFNFQFADANYKWYTSSRGTMTINMLTGSLPRVQALYEQIDQLPNASLNSWNAFQRSVMNELGYPDYSAFDANKNAIVQEVNAAISGTSQSSDLRTKIELENLKTSRSPAQLKAAVSNLREALLARLDASMAGPFPPEVVKGEMSMKEYRKFVEDKYRGNYKSTMPEEAAPVSVQAPAGGPQTPDANAIREKFRAGQITREEAKKQLQALGM